MDVFFFCFFFSVDVLVKYCFVKHMAQTFLVEEYVFFVLSGHVLEDYFGQGASEG